MARYTGPKVRLSRRLSTNLFENEKGRRALERRPFPPGAHGRTRRRQNASEYLGQLQEKQKAKYIYGVLERQFRRTYDDANRLAGPTGENLLRLLEMRLDNVTFRAGWASTRPQAPSGTRQVPPRSARKARSARTASATSGRSSTATSRRVAASSRRISTASAP